MDQRSTTGTWATSVHVNPAYVCSGISAHDFLLQMGHGTGRGDLHGDLGGRGCDRITVGSDWPDGPYWPVREFEICLDDDYQVLLSLRAVTGAEVVAEVVLHNLVVDAPTVWDRPGPRLG